MSSKDAAPTVDRKRKLEDDEEQNPSRMTKQAKINDIRPPQQANAGPKDPPQYCITRDSMLAVKEQLNRLTKKNREINASMQEMREASVDELLSIMRIRKILIDQLGRSDLEDDLRELCKATLPRRKNYMISKEDELIFVEELLGSHEAVLEHARHACQELEGKIEAYGKAMKSTGEPTLTMQDFPRMQALSRLTSGGLLAASTEIQEVPVILPQVNPKIDAKSTFSLFSELPAEIRLSVWEASLPGPRVITHSSKHNRMLTQLAVCTESRKVAKANFIRFLSPGPRFPTNGAPIVYVNPEIDTIVRDLTWASVGVPDASLFDLEGPGFNLGCFRLFTGLSKVKHLALAFDVFHDNGGALFSQLQACCPDLQTLTLFPSSQLQGCYLHGSQLCSCEEFRFVDFDSNLIDLVDFRWGQCRNRILRSKALRGLMTLASLSVPANQYSVVFPEYVERYGEDWKPVIRVALLTRWNEQCQGWQTRYLEGDRYSKGFRGDDGELYRGFVESGIVCNANGELLSRYDGIHQLFADEI